ncbi:phosphatase PAP2 family protein [Nocardia sp. NPDC006044]|uniref:phosphatase PAP2 family protein n=1 Tax=Nocardia sp. NPDC006044 TaxID=3364306 RepID=UPI0036A50AF3
MNSNPNECEAPMAGYGLKLLRRYDIERITAIVRPEDPTYFQQLFANLASQLSITYVVQPRALGTAGALQRWSRVWLGDHTRGQVIVGSILGAALAAITYLLAA